MAVHNTSVKPMSGRGEYPCDINLLHYVPTTCGALKHLGGPLEQSTVLRGIDRCARGGGCLWFVQQLPEWLRGRQALFILLHGAANRIKLQILYNDKR